MNATSFSKGIEVVGRDLIGLDTDGKLLLDMSDQLQDAGGIEDAFFEERFIVPESVDPRQRQNGIA